MGKKTRLVDKATSDKRVGISSLVVQKRVGSLSDFSMDMKIGWNFSKLDIGGRWKTSYADLIGYMDKMIEYEGKTLSEIFFLGNKKHSHPMPTDNVCEAAQKRLELMNIGEDLYQLGIDKGNGERLWAIREHNILHILWLDNDHSVYPMRR